MKKLMMLILSGVSVLVLSACGGGSSSDEYVPVDVHYLTDVLGDGIVGVPYDCIDFVGETDVDGAYEFNPDNYSCEFDLFGLVDDLYIMDEIGGVNGLNYDCSPSEISGITGDFMGAGGFNYDIDDYCLIEAPIL
ncbi:hypothetical protein [Sulfurovum sp. AR]|uniref:hypothetical protein n=1 Tax=Sulfurovum sp. AR TaxID=1165841 RepID=UPI00025C4BE4|nr:hypothetical protein [Sulfurovum sp. AR]EIF50331.1 hypothetical protein SULAR_09664 [Sulfurovum sp. AR]